MNLVQRRYNCFCLVEKKTPKVTMFFLCGLLRSYVSKLVGINSLLTPVFFESVLLSCWFCWYVLAWKQTKPWRLRMKTHQSWDKFFTVPLKNIIHVNLLTLQENKEDRILIISCNLEHLPTPCNKPKQNVLWILLKYFTKSTRWLILLEWETIYNLSQQKCD